MSGRVVATRRIAVASAGAILVGLMPGLTSAPASAVVDPVGSVTTASAVVDPLGSVTTVLGGGLGLAGPATAARLPSSTSLTPDPTLSDAWLLVVERKLVRLRAGAFTPVAILGQDVDAVVSSPTGTRFVSSSSGVFRVDAGGVLTRLAGNGADVGTTCYGTGNPEVSSFPVGGAYLAYDAASSSVVVASNTCVWKVSPAGQVTAIRRPEPGSNGQILSLALDAGAPVITTGGFAWRWESGAWTALGSTVFGASAEPGRPLAETRITEPTAMAVGAAHRLFWSQANRFLLTGAPGTGVVAQLTDRPGCRVAAAPDATHPGVLRCWVDPAASWSSDVTFHSFTMAGTVTSLAGDVDGGPSADGVAASDAHLGIIEGLQTAPDGTLWFTSDGVIRQVTADGLLRTVSSDPRLGSPRRIAFASDGTAYVADSAASQVWVIDPGTQQIRGLSGVSWSTPSSVAVLPSGAVVVADGDRVWSVPRTGAATVVFGGGATEPRDDTMSAAATSLSAGPIADVAVAADGTIAVSTPIRWYLMGDGTAQRLPRSDFGVAGLASAGPGAWWTGDGFRVHQGGAVDVVVAGGYWPLRTAQVATTLSGQALIVTGANPGTQVLRLDDPGIATAEPGYAPTVEVRPGSVTITSPTRLDDLATSLSTASPLVCDSANTWNGTFVRDPGTGGALRGGTTYHAFACRQRWVVVNSTVRIATSAPVATAVVAAIDDEAPAPVAGLRAFEGRDAVEVNFDRHGRPVEPDLDRFVVRYAAGTGFPQTPQDGTAVEVSVSGQWMPLGPLAPGTSYGVSVFALDLTGNYAPPTTMRVALDRTPPGPVTGLTVIPGITSAALSWTLPDDPALGGLRIGWQQGPTAPSEVPDPVGSGVWTGQSIYQLAQGTTYTVGIWTVDQAGNVSTSPTTATFVTGIDTTPPEPPTLVLVNVYDKGATFTATPASPRPPDYGGTNVLVKEGTTGPTSSSDGRATYGLVANTVYTARAFSYDVYGNESASAPITFTTAKDVTAPRIPNMTVSSNQSKRLTLAMRPGFADGSPPDTASYVWAIRPGTEVAAAPDAGRVVPANGATSVVRHETMAANGVYTVTLWAIDAVGNRSEARSATVNVAAQAADLPGVVAGLTVAGVEGGVDVAWSAGTPGASPIASYTVYASDDRGRHIDPVVVDGTQREMQLTVPGRPWTVCIYATNDEGQGPATCANPLTPDDVLAPPPPVGITVSPGVGAATVSWSRTQPLDVDHLVVVRKTGATAPASPTDGVATSLSLDAPFPTFSGLTPGSRYSWAVYAVDRGGLVSGSVAAAPSALWTTLVAPTSIAFSRSASISGVVSVVGTGSAANRTVVLSTRPRGSSGAWTIVTRAVSSSSGAWKTRYAPTASVEVRALVSAPGFLGGSGQRPLTVTPGITAAVMSKPVPSTTTGVRLTGLLQPGRGGTKVAVQRKTVSGWKTVKTIVAPTSMRYVVTAPAKRRGKLVLRVRIMAGATVVATSTTITCKVR